MDQFIYEVNVTLPKAEQENFISYMRNKHAEDVLKHSAFSHARFYVELDPTGESITFSTHYYVTDEMLFDQYANGYGNEMKRDFLSTFQHTHPIVERRLLRIPEEFSAPE